MSTREGRPSGVTLPVVARIGVLEHAFWFNHEPPGPDPRASLWRFWGSNGSNARIWAATPGAAHRAPSARRPLGVAVVSVRPAEARERFRAGLREPTAGWCPG